MKKHPTPILLLLCTILLIGGHGSGLLQHTQLRF